MEALVPRTRASGKVEHTGRVFLCHKRQENQDLIAKFGYGCKLTPTTQRKKTDFSLNLDPMDPNNGGLEDEVLFQ